VTASPRCAVRGESANPKGSPGERGNANPLVRPTLLPDIGYRKEKARRIGWVPGLDGGAMLTWENTDITGKD
jgi:hypothetical protein